MKSLTIFLLISFFIFQGCSTSKSTKNQIKEGELVLRGGVFADKSWEDSLEFIRYSWYQELTLLYDTSWVRLDKKSPFLNWLSKAEQRSVEDCYDFLVFINYALDSDKLSHGSFVGAIKEFGYKEVDIKMFAKNLVLHPDLDDLSLKLYNIYGFCAERPVEQKKGIIRFPGFNDVDIGIGR